MVPGGHGNENPNSNYMNGRGFWLFYVLVLGGVHLILLSVPIEVIIDKINSLHFLLSASPL